MPARFEGQILQALSLGGVNPTTLSLAVTTGNVALPAPTNPQIRLIRLWSSVDCFVRFGGSTVEATTSSHPLTAKVPEVFESNQSYIAGIVSSGTGTLFISPLE